MADDPAFSIVIPAYNYADFLETTLRSVLEQDRPETQVIVVDDCSTDHTPDVVAAFRGVDYVRLDDNRGPGGAWAEGLRLARGEFVAKLDADDWLLPGWFDRVGQGFRDPSVAIVIGSAFVWDEPTNATFLERVTTKARTLGPDAFRHRLLLEMFFRMPSICLRRSTLEGHAPPRSDLRLPHDWEYLLRVTQGGAARLLPDSISVYRIHGSSLTRTAERADRLSDDFRRMAAAATDQSDPAFLAGEERSRLAAGIVRSYLSSALPDAAATEAGGRWELLQRARELAAPLGGVNPRWAAEQLVRVGRRRIARQIARRTAAPPIEDLLPPG